MSDDEQTNTGRVSLKTLAMHLKLSPTTISMGAEQLFRNRVHCAANPGSRLAAAKQFKYKPNRLARSLRLQRIFTISVVVPEFSKCA